MKFPENQDGVANLRKQVALKVSGMDAEIAGLNKQLGVVQRQMKIETFITTVMDGLLNSWQEKDPGKYRGVYFLLDRGLDGRVVFREFLPENVVYRSGWENPNDKQNPPTEGVVPCPCPIVDINGFAKKECRNCHTPQPVIEYYEQTEDGPDGDEWVKERFTFCVECSLMEVITQDTSSHRF